MMLVKIHKKEEKTIIAVCDKDLIGKILEENGKQLDLRAEFYKGEEKTTEEIGDLIRNADGVNLVGQEAIKLGLQEGVIEEENIIKIQGIPHAQAILMQE
ncbi:DUF424 family protein [Candidatus Woesearchaeota archaeon]|nr:DUF424 family protein [Candidatus Woesearchaeota archaeon]MBW3016718.1 DUF424 family protein [Candidatus Woesearchaeota archaeon]